MQHGLITQVFTPNHRKLLSVTTVYWQSLPEGKKKKKKGREGGRDRGREIERDVKSSVCLSVLLCGYLSVSVWFCQSNLYRQVSGFLQSFTRGRGEGGRRGDIQAVDRDL